MKPVTHCPSCNAPVEEYLSEVYCPKARNYDPSCREAFARRIEYFCQTLQIKGVAELTAREIIDKVEVESISDFVSLSKETFNEILGKFGDNIYHEIHDKIGKVTLIKFIVALGVARLGNHAAEKLFEHEFDFKDILLDDYGVFDYDELSRVDDIGDIIVNNIRNFFTNDACRNDARSLYDFFKPVKNEIKLVDDSTIEGYGIVLTGGYIEDEQVFTRDEFKTLLKQYKAIWKSSVSKKTDIVVIGQNPGKSKISKARELGIKTMSNDKFRKLLNR